MTGAIALPERSSMLRLTASREIDICALIGREQIQLDNEAIRRNIEGKTVLVTGAGGSIGSEICRQVNKYNPGALLMLDRDEGGLHATELSLKGQALLSDGDVILADIRDAATLTDIFRTHKPDIVFHAAALKHLALLELFPAEAVQTNVLGTYNVLQAAAASGVTQFVNVSTDKAANPTSVLGMSKRMGEKLTAHMAATHDGTWVSVRFGNVFGSRGSVLSTFQGQIEQGLPVTVTSPDVERYFMTIPEASQLVLQAAVVGDTGETLVLEMGEPVKIAYLAQQLIDLNKRDNPHCPSRIQYTGLRPGEKLSEELVDDREEPRIGIKHPMITHVRVAGEQLPASISGCCHSAKPALALLTAHGS